MRTLSFFLSWLCKKNFLVMRLYYAEVKLFRILVVVIKVVVLLTVLGLLASVVVNAVLDMDHGPATFDVKQTSRIGVCLDQPNTVKQFEIVQQYLDRMAQTCPCCTTNKICDDDENEDCSKCRRIYQALKQEACDQLTPEDFEYMEQHGVQ